MLRFIKEHTLNSLQFGAFPSDYQDDDEAYESSRVVILGVPFDGTATYQSGTKLGPNAILNASVNIEPYDEELEEIYPIGIFTIGTLNIEEIHTDVKKVVDTLYRVSKGIVKDNKFLVTLGGEHSISQGIIRAYKEKYRKLSVLQLDAHLDLMDQFGGTQFSHASVSRRVVDDLKCKVTSFGVRVVSKEELSFARKRKDAISVFYAKDIHDNDDWHDQALETLEDHVYITLDVDGFDTSIMPATGTPVPGGLSWYRTIDFLRKVYKNKKVVGFDVVELKPNPGNEAPNFLAVNLVYKNIGFYKKYTLCL
ncbi:MAG: agmatinase [Candidatus Brocadia sp.]|nr:N(1)-aminopropylagmatine ureohydrolase [Candidatus Brocadia fulgida]MCC6324338.1 agmatinase [Candidatus Brocadia sp.]MCE7912158.1 agmatinase [Candidatus Brocadia sp. AMX3]MDG5997786.1 agmatinase [Candidatus Brocadia sp.]RIJ97058.1 MAG: agmatinase [Candidatus Brocadia sp.]